MTISDSVRLGRNVRIHHPDQVNLYGCSVGDDTRIGSFVEIQKNASIGARCKISSHAFVCEGVLIEDEVFIGHGVMFTNDRFLVVGNGATLLSSPDGLVWTPHVSGYVEAFGGIAFCKGRFVASGRWNKMLSSSNGADWIEHPLGTRLTLTQVAYGADKFVVVGLSNVIEAALFSSSNGVDWRRPEAPFGGDLSSVIFANGLFLVLPNDGPLMVSRDGDIWTIPDENVVANAVA